jgi:hypothetical protein
MSFVNKFSINSKTDKLRKNFTKSSCMIDFVQLLFALAATFTI